jgi:hypothetical protein
MSQILKTCLASAVGLVLSAVVVNVVIFVVVGLVVGFAIPRKIVPKVDFGIVCYRKVRESRWIATD